MKICPVCGSRCFDDMEVCYGCLHTFSQESSEIHVDGIDELLNFEPEPATQLPELQLPDPYCNQEELSGDDGSSKSGVSQPAYAKKPMYERPKETEGADEQVQAQARTQAQVQNRTQVQSSIPTSAQAQTQTQVQIQSQAKPLRSVSLKADDCAVAAQDKKLDAEGNVIADLSAGAKEPDFVRITIEVPKDAFRILHA